MRCPWLFIALSGLLPLAVATHDLPLPIANAVNLQRGERSSITFDAPQTPPDAGALLLFQARLESKEPAGYTRAMVVKLNGALLDGDRFVDRPRRAKSRDGRVDSLASGDAITVFYTPDFEQADNHPRYGLRGGMKTCEFALRITDLLQPQGNTLEIAHVAVVDNALVLANIRLEQAGRNATLLIPENPTTFVADGTAGLGLLPLNDVVPPLLAAVRESRLPLFHVVGGGDYYKELPGHRHTLRLQPASPQATGKVVRDPIRDELDAFRTAHVFVGTHNAEDTNRGFARRDFPTEARPLDSEGIAENGEQLYALCKERGINHLIYCGFAINWCLLLSPGGMADMQRFGIMCSAFRQATTAVENKDTARNQMCKEIALWRVALAYGFVFDVDDFIAALRR